jgi:hypothetical protein
VDGSASPQALLDGHAQTRPDSPEESVYLANNVDGMLLLDLSRAISIARVNSDEFFRVAAPSDRPAQQACSITGAHGPVGRYRFLLWELQGTQGPNTKDTNPTFYGEIDVHEKR